jgi:HD-GYP domain-containing protein (c-di-GMP phosphodiesterase class II)
LIEQTSRSPARTTTNAALTHARKRADTELSMAQNRSFDFDAAPEAITIQELLEEARARPTRRLEGRERAAELGLGLAFLAAAIPMAVFLAGAGTWSLWAIPLVAAYVLASNVSFEVGAGYTVPTEVIFVPMLFAIPAGAVPLVVAGCFVAGKVPAYLTGRARPAHAIVEAGNAWHAVGPALVLALAGTREPVMRDWPLYVAALGAQFAFDLAATTVRERIALGTSPKLQLRVLGWVYLVDALLAPLGLLVALVAVDAPYAFVLVLPLFALLVVFANERRARIDHALELSHAYRGTALLLGEAVELADRESGRRAQGVTLLASMVADDLDLDADERRTVELTALLHDVGKVRIPADILDYPGQLSDEEWDIMRTHTIEGQRMLDRVGGALGEIGVIVRATHERWDGTGYPDHLAGEQIPLAARIVACCHAYDVMTTDTPHRRALPIEFAVQELRAASGTQFDPDVVGALVATIERFEPELTEESASEALDEALRRLLDGG